MELTQEAIPGLLASILDELRRQRPAADEVWSIDDVADYIKRSKNTVERYIIRQGNFPEAHIIPPGGKVWKAKEVRAWLDRQPRDTRRKD